MVPNLFVIGVQKAGTTELHEILGSNKQVFMSDPKELNYFNGISRISNKEYVDIFKNVVPTVLYAGESSPHYWRDKATIKNILEFNGQSKFILLLRHPVDRIESNYQYNVARAIELENPEVVIRKREYTLKSSYVKGIQEIESLHGISEDNFLIITLEQLKNDKTDTLSRISGFLGTEIHDWREGDSVSNKTIMPPKSITTMAFCIRNIPLLGNLVFRLKWNWLKQLFRTRSQIKLSSEVREKLTELLDEDIQLWARVNSRGL